MVIFSATELLPGDAATALLGQAATPEALAAIRNSSPSTPGAVALRWSGWAIS